MLAPHLISAASFRLIQLGVGSSDGRGRIFIGRDTRASGPELEAALARGIASAGGGAVVAGVLPTPAVALLTLFCPHVLTPPNANHKLNSV